MTTIRYHHNRYHHNQSNNAPGHPPPASNGHMWTMAAVTDIVLSQPTAYHPPPLARPHIEYDSTSSFVQVGLALARLHVHDLLSVVGGASDAKVVGAGAKGAKAEAHKSLESDTAVGGVEGHVLVLVVGVGFLVVVLLVCRSPLCDTGAGPQWCWRRQRMN